MANSFSTHGPLHCRFDLDRDGQTRVSQKNDVRRRTCRCGEVRRESLHGPVDILPCLPDLEVNCPPPHLEGADPEEEHKLTRPH